MTANDPDLCKCHGQRRRVAYSNVQQQRCGPAALGGKRCEVAEEFVSAEQARLAGERPRRPAASAALPAIGAAPALQRVTVARASRFQPPRERRDL